MKQYNTQEDGSITIDGITIPPTTDNRHYVQALKEVVDGDAEILPYVAPPDTRTYRELRQEQYIKELSPEGNFNTTTGDMLDALIDAAYGDSTQLDLLKAKIDQIRLDIPKD